MSIPARNRPAELLTFQMMPNMPIATPEKPKKELPTMALTLGIMFAQGSGIALLLLALIGLVVALA